MWTSYQRRVIVSTLGVRIFMIDTVRVHFDVSHSDHWFPHFCMCNRRTKHEGKPENRKTSDIYT